MWNSDFTIRDYNETQSLALDIFYTKFIKHTQNNLFQQKMVSVHYFYRQSKLFHIVTVKMTKFHSTKSFLPE